MSSKFSKFRIKIAHTPKVCKSPPPRRQPEPPPPSLQVVATLDWDLVWGFFDMAGGDFTGDLTNTSGDNWTASGVDSFGFPWQTTWAIPPGGGAVIGELTTQTPYGNARGVATLTGWTGATPAILSNVLTWDPGPTLATGSIVLTLSTP